MIKPAKCRSDSPATFHHTDAFMNWIYLLVYSQVMSVYEVSFYCSDVRLLLQHKASTLWWVLHNQASSLEGELS